MELTHDQISEVVNEIAEAIIFHNIDPHGRYLVCNDKVSAWVTDQLMKQVPVGIVFQKEGVMDPPRDYGIYLLVDTTSADHGGVHNSMDIGWASSLMNAGAAIMRSGADITVSEILICAQSDVLMRLQAMQDTP